MHSESFQTAKTEAPAGGETLEGSEHMMRRIIIPESHQSCSQTAASCTNPAALAPKLSGRSDPKARECNKLFPGGERMSSHPAHTTASLKALASDLPDQRLTYPRVQTVTFFFFFCGWPEPVVYTVFNLQA